MNLVVGATGLLGGEIVRRLRRRRQPVRALVRKTSDAAQVAELERMGADLVVGDLKDTESLTRACEGTTTIVSTATAILSQQEGDSIERVDRQGQADLVEAAAAANVHRFVLVSVSANLEADNPLISAKRATETRLQQRGLDYTILQPTYFMEVWLGPALGFDLLSGTVTMYGPGLEKVSWISLGDVAEFAVQSIDHPSTVNRAIPLGGPEALSPLEVVDLAQDILARDIRVNQVPVAALEEQRSTASDATQQTVAALCLALSRGDPIDMTSTMAEFPMQLTSVRDYLRSLVEAGRPSSPNW